MFLIHLLSAVHALIFLARWIQPFLSLVDREVEFCVLTIQSFSTRWAFLVLFFSFLVGKIPAAGIELTSQRVRELRGTSELPGRPAATSVDPPKGGSMILVTRTSDQARQWGCVWCVCVCVVIPFILDVRLLVGAPAGVTQGEGRSQRISTPSSCGACLDFLSGEGFNRPFP